MESKFNAYGGSSIRSRQETYSTFPPHACLVRSGSTKAHCQQNGTAVPSLISRVLEDDGLTPEKEHLIKWTAFTMYAGGADTVCLLLSLHLVDPHLTLSS